MRWTRREARQNTRTTAWFSRQGLLPLLFLFVLLLAGVGCKRKSDGEVAAPPVLPPPVPVLGDVVITDVTPEGSRPRGVTLALAALGDETRARLDGARIFRKDPAASSAGHDVRARVRVDMSFETVAVSDKAAARAAVRLRIDTRPSEIADVHWDEDVQAAAETVYPLSPPPDLPKLFQRLASRTVADLVDGYLARQRLWTDDGSAARAALTGDAGNELRLEALRAIGERRLSAAASDVLTLLGASEERVRDAALGALVSLRDRRAVAVLTSERSMRDAREMRKILDAIATLGGNEAAEYLGFVADGHDDPEIRAMAADARKRLLRRSDATP